MWRSLGFNAVLFPNYLLLWRSPLRAHRLPIWQSKSHARIESSSSARHSQIVETWPSGRFAWTRGSVIVSVHPSVWKSIAFVLAHRVPLACRVDRRSPALVSYSASNLACYHYAHADYLIGLTTHSICTPCPTLRQFDSRDVSTASGRSSMLTVQHHCHHQARELDIESSGV